MRKLSKNNAILSLWGENPGKRTTFDMIVAATKSAKAIVGDRMFLFSGKKGKNSVDQKVICDPLILRALHEQFVKDLIDVGADVICMPMPGCRTGINVEDTRSPVTLIRTYKSGTLALNLCGNKHLIAHINLSLKSLDARIGNL